MTLYFSHFVMATPVQGQIEERPPGQYFEVPAMSVQHFVGRKQLLERMKALFEAVEKDEERTKVLVLRGMGGM